MQRMARRGQARHKPAPAGRGALGGKSHFFWDCSRLLWRSSMKCEQPREILVEGVLHIEEQPPPSKEEGLQSP